jgi:hypothetical protein
MNIVSTIPEFLSWTEKSDLDNMTMIIGYNLSNPADLARELDCDISLDRYDIEKLDLELDKLVFNWDFNSYCLMNERIINKFSHSVKINKIIFDSSTWKFVSNVKFLGIFYYLTLKVNGSIYVEANSPVSTNFIIEDVSRLESVVEKINYSEGFCYSVGSILPKRMEEIMKKKYPDYERFILDKDYIYLLNATFFSKWFYGSKVEILDTDYPITNPAYPIVKYYKITKILPQEEIFEWLNHNVELVNRGLEQKTQVIIRP